MGNVLAIGDVRRHIVDVEKCSCRLWQETVCSATPCVCEQMDDAVNYDYALIFFLTRFYKTNPMFILSHAEKKKTLRAGMRVHV